MSCRPSYSQFTPSNREIAFVMITYYIMMLVLFLLIAAFATFIMGFWWALIKGGDMMNQLIGFVEKYWIIWALGWCILIVPAVLDKVKKRENI